MEARPVMSRKGSREVVDLLDWVAWERPKTEARSPRLDLLGFEDD